MHRRRAWKFAYYSLLFLEWLTGLLTPAIGASLKATSAQAQKLGQWADNLLNWIQPNAWWLLIILAFVFGFAKFLRSSMGSPWLWEQIHSLLDEIQVHVFSDRLPSPPHHHRVTLFRYVRFCVCTERPWYKSRITGEHWPWSGWLIPVARSGNKTQKTRTVFRAPDYGDSATGVAGWTWNLESNYRVHALPDVSGAASRAKLTQYAAETHVTVEWLLAKKTKARSFCGIPLDVKKTLWGVIVMDSRNANEIPLDKITDANLFLVPRIEALLTKLQNPFSFK